MILGILGDFLQFNGDSHPIWVDKEDALS